MKDNLNKAMEVKHWMGHRLYPQLIEQMLRYFVASDVKSDVFEKDWRSFLEKILDQGRLDGESKRMILDINDIYSGNLQEPNVDPRSIGEIYSEWKRAKSYGRFNSGLEALSSFLKMRGDQYYRQRDEKSMENSLICYSHAWALNAENVEAGLYLANVLLYDVKEGGRQLDQRYNILDAFINQLFEAKNAQYQKYLSNLATDWERILKCHIILATIFEEQGRWGPGNYSRTALFQWELARNALGKLDASAADTQRRFGPVITDGFRQAQERWKEINQ
jgi:hypothetical protein